MSYWQLIGNCPRHWSFSLMVCFSSSMPWLGRRRCLMRPSGQKSLLVPSAAPPGSVVIITCHDDHQKVKGCLPRHESWGFVPHLMRSGGTLMRSGGAVHIVATWHIMVGGVNAPLVRLFGFPLAFDFLCLVFKLPFSSLSSPLFLFPPPLLLYAFSSLSCSLPYNFLRSSFLWVPFSKVQFLLAFLFFVT